MSVRKLYIKDKIKVIYTSVSGTLLMYSFIIIKCIYVFRHLNRVTEWRVPRRLFNLFVTALLWNIKNGIIWGVGVGQCFDGNYSRSKWRRSRPPSVAVRNLNRGHLLNSSPIVPLICVKLKDLRWFIRVEIGTYFQSCWTLFNYSKSVSTRIYVTEK